MIEVEVRTPEPDDDVPEKLRRRFDPRDDFLPRKS
jgi:hypothetical protein